MTRKEYLEFAEGLYRASRVLIELTKDELLAFRPQEGMMSIGQVIKHMVGCLGEGMDLGLKQDWPYTSDDEMLPSAEKMATITSAEQAVKDIDADWALCQKIFESITDGEFNQNKLEVPWMPFPMTVRQYMMQSAEHLSNHRMQLFTHLKLAGEKLHTGHLYGMP